MNSVKKIFKIYALPIVMTWFVCTIFVDIIAVPAVFRNVTKVEEAGRVGMTVFTTFNRFELVFALIFIFGAKVFYEKLGKKIYLIIPLVLLVWILSYNLYFTPQIVFYTKMIHSAPANDPLLATYQINHTFYHHLYRYLDTFKLLMLLLSIILMTKDLKAEEK